jgi:hypothetical protein
MGVSMAFRRHTVFPMTTVVIPAHNEGRVIGRLLDQLVPITPPGDLNVLVVANGCTDDTAEVAAAFGAGVQVISIPVASKYAALTTAARAVTDFPLIYVDADVELRTEDVVALAAALRQPGVHAAAPERVLDLDGRPRAVRWYYDIWTRLPEAQSGLWGRGVIAVDECGQQRVAGLPPLLGDDLAASLLFEPHERAIVGSARVIVHPSRTFADLLRRRIRATTGVAQLEQTECAPASTARTQVHHLTAIIRREPRMAPRVAFFLAVAVVARLRARRAVARRDFTTWLRDESSRLSPATGSPATDTATPVSPLRDDVIAAGPAGRRVTADRVPTGRGADH